MLADLGLSSILLVSLMFLKRESTGGRCVGRDFDVMGKTEAEIKTGN